MQNNVLLVGLAGGSGSGKTTFAQRILKQVENDQIAILHMDSYYHPDSTNILLTELGHPNFDHPSAFDWDLLRSHLQQLKNNQIIKCPVYNFHKGQRVGAHTPIGPCKVILFEGIYGLFDKEIRELLDIKLFLHVDADIRFTRRLRRDVKERGRCLESVIEQYYDSVRPMYLKYLSPQQQYADLIVGEETEIAASVISAKIKDFLTTTTMANATTTSNTIEKIHEKR